MKRYLIAVGVLGCVATIWWWSEQPKTPKDLFVARCSTCHEVPNLTQYEDERIPVIVKAMREQNGAADIIDEDESQVIVDYILSRRRANERSAESQ